MGDTITQRFIKKFDANNESHVKWLQKMTVLAPSLGDPNARNQVVNDINDNPMKIKVSTVEALDWPHIHFVLATSYATQVLTGKAFIPPRVD
jgi:hypothetical protein